MMPLELRGTNVKNGIFSTANLACSVLDLDDKKICLCPLKTARVYSNIHDLKTFDV